MIQYTNYASSVKSLEPYFFERGLASTYPIEILRNCKLGIDVNHYLARLISFKKESFLDAIGGFPNSLKLYIESDLQVFKEHNITPIFVFSGNDIVDQYNFKNSKDTTPLEKQRNRAWTNYQAYVSQNQHSNLPLTATETFREFTTPFSAEPITKDLIDYFTQNDLDYMIAPYLSWVQLSYLYEQDYIDAIYGPTETILLPNVEKFILGMEFPANEFRFVDRRKVLHDFGIGPQNLLDIAVSVGCDLQPTTLPLYNGYVGTQIFDVALDIITSGGNLYANILALNNDDITAKFQRGVLALRYMPVMKSNGRVGLLNYNESEPDTNIDSLPPSDIHEIVGQRLPHEYYFYESIGLINPKILESIVFGTYVERPPLDGGIPSQYKSLVRASVNAFKNKELNLLTANIARYYQVKKIHYVKYFDNDPIELENRMSPPIFLKINGLVVRSTEKDFKLSTFLSSLTKEDLVGAKVVGAEQESKRLQTNYEVISTSLLRSLYLLGFFEIDVSGGTTKLKSNKWTKALFTLSKLDEEFQQRLLILLILLKLNVFKFSEVFTPNLVGGPKTSEKDDLSLVLLVSRLGTFIQVEQKAMNYVGPISRSLLSFRSSIDLIKNNFRELIECVLVNSLSNNEVAKLSRTNQEWRKLSSQLPYKKVTPNTILGIVYQTFMDLYFSSRNLASAKATTLEFFNTPGNSIVNLEKDFITGFKFIKEAFKLVKVLHEDKLVDSKDYEAFGKADVIADEVLNL